MALRDSFLNDPALRRALFAAAMDHMHRESLLLHMPMDGTPESQACTEHVLPGIYSRDELKRLVAFNEAKKKSAGRNRRS